MKVGVRKPSLKKSIKARTTGKLKRSVKKAVNPFYGKKGTGMITNPKKAVYNKVYRKTTVDSRKLFSAPKKRRRKAAPANTKAAQASRRTTGNQSSVGYGVGLVVVLIICGYIFLPLAIIVLIAAVAYYIYAYHNRSDESEDTEDAETEEVDTPAPVDEPTPIAGSIYDDEPAQALQKQYYSLLEKVEAEYKRLNGETGFAGEDGDRLIKSCRKGITMSKELTDIWTAYGEPVPRIPFFYRLAMVLEKRGEYEDAVQVCADAIRSGQSDDGTKGGMTAKIQRLIKKGGLTPSEDILELLQS